MRFYCAIAHISLPLCQYKNLVIEMLIWHWCDCFKKKFKGFIIKQNSCLAGLFSPFINIDQLSQLARERMHPVHDVHGYRWRIYKWQHQLSSKQLSRSDAMRCNIVFYFIYVQGSMVVQSVVLCISLVAIWGLSMHSLHVFFFFQCMPVLSPGFPVSF